MTLTAKVGDNGATTRVGMTKGEDSYADFYRRSDDAVLVQTVDGGTLTVTADITVVWSGHSDRTGNGYFFFVCSPCFVCSPKPFPAQRAPAFAFIPPCG